MSKWSPRVGERRSSGIVLPEGVDVAVLPAVKAGPRRQRTVVTPEQRGRANKGIMDSRMLRAISR